MSATMTVPIGVTVMPYSKTTPSRLSPIELKEVVRKIHALRRVTKTTGFFTTNAIVELLSKLSADDLIAVGEELTLKPREIPRPTSEVRQS